MRTFIIAEAGVNHNGNLELAKKMIDAAVTTGVDAIKFQTAVPELVISRFTEKAPYQKETTGTTENMLEMVRPLHFNASAHREIAVHCKDKGIIFLSTPYDEPSVDLLCELGCDTFKIASADIVDLPLLRKVGRLKKNVILSTGMATMDEIYAGLNVLTDAGTLKRNITLLHCHTDYPTQMEDANLRAMQTIKGAFDVAVGYSDHTVGIEVPIAAVALGATTVEKHFTLDRTMHGPDHAASLEVPELAAMVCAIRNIERALGDGIKRPTARETTNLKVMRRSIVAARDIKKGEVFDASNIIPKRPGFGISPMRFDEIVGKVAIKDFQADELIVL